MLRTYALAGCLLIAGASLAQQKMDFEKYDPVSTLKVPEHPVSRAKFPL